MVRKITIGMVFFMLVSASIYSQIVETDSFEFIGNSEFLGRLFEEDRDDYTDGWFRIERLPNSVINEIKHQLTDYHPLNNGEIFIWRGDLSTSTGSDRRYIAVLVRITDAINSQWEYSASGIR
jgi:hypothetical protein